MNTTSKGAVVIVGAGPGVSGSLARLWADAGHPIGLVGTEQGVLDALSTDLRARGVDVHGLVADITDTSTAPGAFARLVSDLEQVHLLHFNPSAFREASVLTLGVEELLEDVALGVGGLLTALQAVRPAMRPGSRITATGSMAADKPWSGAPSLGVQKAGLRNLIVSIDTTLAERDIRATSVTVRGALAPEGPVQPGPGGRRDLRRRPSGTRSLAHRGDLRGLNGLTQLRRNRSRRCPSAVTR